MSITKYGQVVTSTDTSKIDDYTNFIRSNPILKDASLFDFKDIGNGQYEVSFSIVDTNQTYSENDYCFSSLMYCREEGYFYFYPSYVNTLIPLVDACKMFDNTVANLYRGRQSNIPKQSLDNLFQNVKLGTGIAKTPNKDLLAECLNYYNTKASKTIIGSLLYANDNRSPDLSLTNDDFIRFFTQFNKTLLSLIPKFAKAVSTLEGCTGLLRTYTSVCSASLPVFDSDSYEDAQFILNKGNSDLSCELSTNIIFNSVARDYLHTLIDRKSKDGFTTDKRVEFAYDKYMQVANAVDMIDRPEIKLYSSYMNISNTALPRRNYGGQVTDPRDSSDEFEVNGIKLLRPSNISKLIDTSDPVDAASLNKSLDDIEDNDSGLVDPSVVTLPSRVLKSLNSLFTQYS